ncbi:DNA cytosine methyltransferase [Rhizobium leguminosarum]
MAKPRPAANSSDPLGNAKSELLKLQSAQTRIFLSIAKKIVDLRSEMAARDASFDLEAWLQSELGCSPADAKLFAGFDEKLAASTLLKRRRASPEIIATLSKAEAKTRAACLDHIRRGDFVDVPLIEKIGKDNELAAMSADDLAQFGRSELFHKAAEERVALTLAGLEAGAAELLTSMELTRIDPVQVHLGEPLRANVDRGRVAKTLSERASQVLADLEAMTDHYRPPRGFLAQYGASVSWVSLQHARQALKELKAGKIRPHELISGEKGPVVHRWCLEFLAGKRASAISDGAASGGRRRVISEPTFIDIDAGVGGSTLGLMGAGMSPVHILARSAYDVAAISKNGEFGDDIRMIRKDMRDQLNSLKKQQIDVVTSGLPWHYYKDEEEEQRAYDNAVVAVEVLKPETFFFEARPKVTSDERIKGLEELGYDVRWHELEGSRFGLVQSKTRHVLIGGRKGSWDAFSMPILPVQTQSLAATIGDLVDADIENEEHRRAVNAWLERCDGKAAPPFKVGADKYGIVPQWKVLGIDPRSFQRKPPGYKDFKHGKGFKLSIDMVKRIQSFPHEWNVEAAVKRDHQIAGAFPPVMARMIGLALHSIMAGVEFDYERALTATFLGAAAKRRPPAERSWVFDVTVLTKDPNRAFRDRERERRRTRQPAASRTLNARPLSE